MRNENLELAQSSGSESSPSWAGAATPKASTFNFEFSNQPHNQQSICSTSQQPKTGAITEKKEIAIEDLTTQLKVTLKPSRSTDDVLSQEGARITALLQQAKLAEEQEKLAIKDEDNEQDDSNQSSENVFAGGIQAGGGVSPNRRLGASGGGCSGVVTGHLHLSAVATGSKSKSFHYDYGSGSSGDYDSGTGTGAVGSSSSSGDPSGKKHGKESKIARFLRRTQSANEESSSCMLSKAVSGDGSKTEVEGSQHYHHHQHQHYATGSSSSSHSSQLREQSSYQHVASQPKAGDDTITTSASSGTEEGRPGSAAAAAAAARSKRHKFASVGTDMKFRLGFLKRRHTEGQIHSTSVRPPPEEAQKWANSFNDLMASKYGQALFKAFLQREFSEENIEFWLAIEDYRKSRQNKLNTKAQKIYNDFIIPQAPKEVNLDSLTKDSLVTKMAQPTHTTFDQAQKRIQGLLEADAYSRFLKSDLYMELVHPERYQQPSP